MAGCAIEALVGIRAALELGVLAVPSAYATTFAATTMTPAAGAIVKPGSVTAQVESDSDLFPRGQVVSAADRSVRVPPGGKAALTVPLAAASGRCTARFAVTPTAIPAVVLHTTDTRLLGIHFTRFVFHA